MFLTNTFNPSYFFGSILLLLLFGTSIGAQTTLAPGDVVFTLLNMEGNNDDAFGFVLLTDVAAGTSVTITDNEYVTGSGFGADSEGNLTITFDQAFSCGTEVFITDASPVNDQYEFQASIPGVTTSDNLNERFQLSTAGETLIMFQGDNLTNPCATCFVAALANTGVDFGVAATGSGDLPPGLVVGQSAMAMTAQVNGDEWDNIKYNCSTSQADPAELRTALLSPANWSVDDAAALPVTACSFACSAQCVAPVFEGITITDCSGGATGFNTFQINGQLNGAVNWEWRGPEVEGQSCSEQIAITTGSSATIAFFFPQRTHHIVAIGGCLAEEICFPFVPAELLGVTTFSPLPNVCLSDGIQTGLSGGSPIGGVYSGVGVTDDNNGTTFSFDPTAVGAGTATITYTPQPGTGCAASVVVQNVLVLPTPDAMLVIASATVSIDAGIQTGLSGGTPTGGVYSGAGVTDNGNGMTYSFDPAVAGIGVTTITYTVTNADGCLGSANGTVTVEVVTSVDGNECADATDLSSLFGQAVGEAQTSSLFNNNDATNEASDPTFGYECFGEPDGGGATPSLENTLWYTFTGDGNTYAITSVQCNATDYIDFGDTQIAIYAGDCSNLSSAGCNEDAPDVNPNGPYPSEVTLATEPGVVYRMMIDGFAGSNGEFCVEVTRTTDVAVTNIKRTEIKAFPNPTASVVNLNGVTAYRIEVVDHTGRKVIDQYRNTNQVDLNNLPQGVYLFKIYTENERYSAKIVKQ